MTTKDFGVRDGEQAVELRSEPDAGKSRKMLTKSVVIRAIPAQNVLLCRHFGLDQESLGISWEMSNGENANDQAMHADNLRQKIPDCRRGSMGWHADAGSCRQRNGYLYADEGEVHQRQLVPHNIIG